MKHILLKATFRLLLAAVMVYLLPTAAWGQENTAATGDFTVTGDAGHYSWDDSKKELKITGDIEVKNTNPNTATGHTIKVVGGSEGSPIIVTLAGVNIDATIETSTNTAAMDVSDSFVTVKLKDTNSLKSRGDGAGLQKNGDKGSLTIESINGGNNHSLRAEGGGFSAGIGSVSSNNAHNITINSGKIEAYGGSYSAGIGGGLHASTSNITINGGHIIARGGGDASCGIGAGRNGTDTNIHITGGYIEAENGNWYMNGIGADNATDTEISGGTLILKGGWASATYGIGGKPSITGGSIRLASDAPKNCKLMQNQPNDVELREITIDNNAALEGLSFMDPNQIYGIKDVKADDKGKVYLYVPKEAEVKSFTYNGSEKFAVTFDKQYDNRKDLSFMDLLSKPNDPTRYYYTFKGWFTSADCKEGEDVKDWNTKVTDAVTYYAKWAPNTFSFTGGKTEFTYGEEVGRFDLEDYITEESGSTGSKTLTITSGSLPDGLELYYGSIYGTPTSASPTEEGSTILLNITSNGNDYSLENQPLTIYIKKRDLTVTLDNSQTVYKDEDPTYQVTEGLLSGQTACFTGSLQIENNLIVRGSLALADGEAGNDFKASNYNLIVATDVPITVHDQSLDEAVKAKTLDAFAASHPDAILSNGWINAHGDITITAPAGYKIQPALNNRADNWGDSYAFAFDADGNIPVPFQIRNETSSKIYDRSFTLKTDATAPTIGKETTKDLTFSVPLADATSGIASYTWLLNDGAEETVTLSGFPQSETFTHSGKEGENKLLLSVTDQAGNTLPAQTILFSLTVPVDPPVPPVNPDQPDPTPVYYTVALPSVEGATTDPVAGEYEVEAYSSFRFYLTLDKEYDQSEPVVTTDRGETITPRSSDGAYIVKYIRQPLALFIDGIVKNPDPVGNEVVATDAVNVWATKGNLHISTVTGQTARVYNLAGALVKQAEIPAGDTLWPLPSGIYIVQIADTRYKVIL